LELVLESEDYLFIYLYLYFIIIIILFFGGRTRPGARTGTDIFGGNFEKKRLKPGAN
jgi:hypothetical protein